MTTKKAQTYNRAIYDLVLSFFRRVRIIICVLVCITLI